jgi:hypothetical protein
MVNATLRQLNPREIKSTNCVVGLVGPSTGLDGCEKSPPSPGFFKITYSDNYTVVGTFPFRP